MSTEHDVKCARKSLRFLKTNFVFPEKNIFFSLHAFSLSCDARLNSLYT